MKMLGAGRTIMLVCAAFAVSFALGAAAQTPNASDVSTAAQSTANPAAQAQPKPTEGTDASKARQPVSSQPALWVQLVTGVAWPVSLLFIVLLFAFHPRLNRVLGLAKVVRKIKAAGVEMEINADAVDAVRAELRASVKELIAKARDEYDRMAGLMKISNHLENALSNGLLPALQKRGIAIPPKNMRGTVHVRDIVFTEYLYQLIGYSPTRDGAGRRFPQRYGIIGRSWRLDRSLGEGDAFAAGKGDEETLVEEWGMTRDDARSRGRSRRAYLSVVLRGVVDDKFPNGILYVDSTVPDAFGDDKTATEIAVELEECESVMALRKALEKMLAPLRLAAPNLEVTQLSE